MWETLTRMDAFLLLFFRLPNNEGFRLQDDIHLNGFENFNWIRRKIGNEFIDTRAAVKLEAI